MADGTPLDLEATYTCTVREDNASGLFSGSETTLIGATICPTVIDYLNSGVEISSETAGRITPVEGSFPDLEGHWGKETVDGVLARKSMSGYPDGTFRPDELVTFAEFKKVLTSAFSLSDEDAAAIFPEDAAAETLTRQNAALYIRRMLDTLGLTLPEGEAESFTDIGEVSEEAAAAIAALQRGGIINGVGGGLYAPKGNTTRAQLATLVSRLLTNAAAEEAAA